jgi:hypothetical protein
VCKNTGSLVWALPYALIHRSAWKEYSPKSTSCILHIPYPLRVEDGLLRGPSLITRHNIWKQ